MDALELLVSALAKTLNKSTDDIKSIILKPDSAELNDDALDKVLSLDTERITAINNRNKTDKESQFKRGYKEASEKWTRDVRDGFGLDADVTDEELLEKAKTKIGAGSKGGGEITDDKVKAHPVYLALQKEKRDKEKELNDGWQKKLDDQSGEFNKKATRGTVKTRTIELAKALKPKLSEDPAKAERQLEQIFLRLETEGYEFEPDGDDFIVKKGGENATDSHNNLVRFADLVKQATTSLYDLDATKKTDTGNGKDNFGKKWDHLNVPSTKAEFDEAIKKAASPEERTALSKAFLATEAGKS